MSSWTRDDTLLLIPFETGHKMQAQGLNNSFERCTAGHARLVFYVNEDEAKSCPARVEYVLGTEATYGVQMNRLLDRIISHRFYMFGSDEVVLWPTWDIRIRDILETLPDDLAVVELDGAIGLSSELMRLTGGIPAFPKQEQLTAWLRALGEGTHRLFNLS